MLHGSMVNLFFGAALAKMAWYNSVVIADDDSGATQYIYNKIS